MSMARAMILLVRPANPDDAEENIAAAMDEEEYARRWEECSRLEKALESLGFCVVSGRDHSTYTMARLEGCNWEADANVLPMFISTTNIALLEGRVLEVAALRASALAKLSPEEQLACGLLFRQHNEKTIYPDMYRE